MGTHFGFMKHAMPPRRAFFPEITPQLLLKSVASKHKHSAIGPDGVSKADVLNMPQSAVQDIVWMFQHIERGAAWPRQLITGHVAALAKTPKASAIQTNLCFPTPFQSLGKYQSSSMPAILGWYGAQHIAGQHPEAISSESVAPHPTSD